MISGAAGPPARALAFPFPDGVGGWSQQPWKVACFPSLISQGEESRATQEEPTQLSTRFVRLPVHSPSAIESYLQKERDPLCRVDGTSLLQGGGIWELLPALVLRFSCPPPSACSEVQGRQGAPGRGQGVLELSMRLRLCLIKSGFGSGRCVLTSSPDHLNAGDSKTVLCAFGFFFKKDLFIHF